MKTLLIRILILSAMLIFAQCNTGSEKNQIDPLLLALGLIVANTPAETENNYFPQGLALWLDAAQAETYNNPTYGTVASTWKDRSLYYNNVTQSNAALQAPFLANQLNGLPAMDFNYGTKRYTNNFPRGLDSDSFTFFVVIKRVVSVGGTILSIGPTGTTGARRFYLEDDNAAGGFGSIHLMRDGTPGNTTTILKGNTTLALDGKYYLGVMRYDANGNANYYQNGVSDGSAAMPVSFNSGILKVGRRTNGGNGMQAQVPEMLYFNNALSEADRLKVQCYLSSKYALNLAGCDGEFDVSISPDPADDQGPAPVLGFGAATYNASCSGCHNNMGIGDRELGINARSIIKCFNEHTNRCESLTSLTNFIQTSMPYAAGCDATCTRSLAAWILNGLSDETP